ncbi:MAG: hypothetical protein L0K72_08130, partial [Enterococcus sp.]|nr:hypothetical protein [Enterococcus sp.]
FTHIVAWLTKLVKPVLFVKNEKQTAIYQLFIIIYLKIGLFLRRILPFFQTKLTALSLACFNKCANDSYLCTLE